MIVCVECIAKLLCYGHARGESEQRCSSSSGRVEKTWMGDRFNSRGGSISGQGCIFSPNVGLAPKCDMKHCLTNSKH